MNRFSYKLFLYSFAIFTNDFCYRGLAEKDETKIDWHDTQKSSLKVDRGKGAVGVIVSQLNEPGENILSASVSGGGAAVISGAIGENGTITGSANTGEEGEQDETAASVSGPGVISLATGNATTFSVMRNGTIYTFSYSGSQKDDSIGIASSGEGHAEIKPLPGMKTKSNVVGMRKSKSVSASAAGSITSTAISSKEGFASGSSTSGEGMASGSSSEAGSASAILFYHKKKIYGGIASSGSSSGGKASSSISASDDLEDDSDDSDLSSSVSAISARQFPMTLRFRRYMQI